MLWVFQGIHQKKKGTPIDGLLQEQNKDEKYPKVIKEAFQVFECTWVKELDNAQNDVFM